MNRIVLSRVLIALIIALALAIVPAQAEDKDKGIADELRPFVESKTLAGAVVLVANKDKVLCLETVGYADIKNKKLMRPDSVFWIASMTKPITAAALMMLVDEGKVKLDDPVEKYLPEFSEQWLAVEKDKERIVLKKPKQSVTVRHILNHTSGMPGVSRIEQEPARLNLDRLNLRDAVISYVMTPLQSEPGTKWHYSNPGINTAGRIIEVVSKMPYEKFMQERLFDPLKMTDTTFWPDEKQLARLAKVYRPNKGKDDLEETTITLFTHPLSDRKRQPMPAGGLFSTASDVSNFCRMVLAGGEFGGKRYLSEKAVKDMTVNQTGDLPISFGLGWATGKKEGEPFGHGGAYGTNMSIDPKKGLVLVYMIQHTGGFPGKDGGKIHPAFVKAATQKYGK
jgi:CubicO group peptidase (beta-lactamase class C family)